jgi:hypothetical protein
LKARRYEPTSSQRRTQREQVGFVQVAHHLGVAAAGASSEPGGGTLGVEQEGCHRRVGVRDERRLASREHGTG